MKRSRRKRQRPAPESGWEAEIPPSRLETEVARIMREGEAKRAALFAEVLSPLPDIAELKARSGSDDDNEPKNRPGSAAAWIDDLWPKGKWRLMKIKRMHTDIVNTAKDRNVPDLPSETAVRDEVNRRLGKPPKRGKHGKRGQRP